jgi:hypothetical protein
MDARECGNELCCGFANQLCGSEEKPRRRFDGFRQRRREAFLIASLLASHSARRRVMIRLSSGLAPIPTSATSTSRLWETPKGQILTDSKSLQCCYIKEWLPLWPYTILPVFEITRLISFGHGCRFV